MTQLTVERRLPEDFLASSLRADAYAGLTAFPKSLPPKWFYDAQGSALFEKITELPEYYPTRAERSILRSRAASIASLSGARTLVELGSGSSEKTRLLLDALRGAGTLRRYVAVDVSESALLAAGQALVEAYPGLAVDAVVSDFEEHLGLPSVSDGPRLVAFLGSTIGNLLPPERRAFLSRVRAVLQPGDAFLLGTDLVKDVPTLLAAYDDPSGVTAAFNKNVLSVLNASLGADFDLDSFEHVAVWDSSAEWVEMRLRSTVAQTVRLALLDLDVRFDAGEEMRTEVSAKFRRAGVFAELTAAGFSPREWWTDPDGQFGLSISVLLWVRQTRPASGHCRGLSHDREPPLSSPASVVSSPLLSHRTAAVSFASAISSTSAVFSASAVSQIAAVTRTAAVTLTPAATPAAAVIMLDAALCTLLCAERCIQHTRPGPDRRCRRWSEHANRVRSPRARCPRPARAAPMAGGARQHRHR